MGCGLEFRHILEKMAPLMLYNCKFLLKVGVDHPGKLGFLYKYLSPATYDYLGDCFLYKDVSKTLEKFFLKPPNEVCSPPTLYM